MTQPNFDLTGRRALVTGASRGIGQAIAIALAKAGADVAITARAVEGLAETRELIEKSGSRSVTLAQDVRDVEACGGVTRAAAEMLGGLDILVNNAGFENVRPSFDVDEALWESILSTNLKGAFFCAQAAGRIMAEAGGGAIVNLCSLTSYVGIPTAAPYGASKSGLLGVTRALASEWAAHNIRVNAIAPGYFRTAMTEGFYENEDWQSRMLAKIPQRRFGKESDIGGVAVFLCSDAAAYVTGHCIPVDGGYLASI
ncbi:NAD(P)-dependent dehydrogenase, short-chain alcohol dehydrogenase family [Rhizobium mongolense subsp. loessense]|uniref:NAD(P)-dependent dehydrogenase, short-chain alcohol dehydrogenase family n=1 Tax=Rhizobium mongolense subsp. loessense TaxID=158890 RepID=A0A1G4QXI1_9HYPH|nr:glucose 1-dehydrogenase [Rhizobium mongolense]SCW49137.1 NAD(P)-dependent dehydrogenase, short-chain alcohol dehydrogenase family [Rhizobium mongolense subsp. loessense]